MRDDIENLNVEDKEFLNKLLNLINTLFYKYDQQLTGC